MKLLFRVICISLLVLVLPNFSHAQIGGSGPQQFLTVTTVPEFPKTNDPVTILLESFSFDLSTSKIVWSVGGKIIGQGTGDVSASLNAGRLGQTTTVSITITPLKGSVVYQNVNITPATVDFLWQAKTYTPPFYKGKALFSGQAPVTVVAIPQISVGSGLVSADSLVYHWTLNEDNLPDQSGYAKQSVDIGGSFWGSDDVVKTTISTPQGDTVAENTLTLKPQTPQILIYENNPLLGVLFNHTINNLFIINQNSEISFFAAPMYFISGLLSNNKTTYNWTVNGQPAAGTESGNTITFRQSSGQTGISNIGLDVGQASTNFQNASIGFSIQSQ